MSGMFEDFIEGGVFEEFEYRLLYLRPTPYSQEQIAVGLISSRQGALEARFVSSTSALDLMGHLLGKNAVEQFQFAAGEVRRAISACTTLQGFTVPSDLFVLGEKLAAVTHDPRGLLASVLSAASCLLRSEVKKTELLESTPPTQLQRDLFDRVSQLNPLIGRQIFNNKFTADTGQVVNLPILGRRIFGAPISFAAREQRMKAESFVAKFRWLGSQMPQEPRIYLLVSEIRGGENLPNEEPGVRELKAIAEASGVSVKISESTDGMASQIIGDEAA